MANTPGKELLRNWVSDTGRKISWLAKTIPANRSLVHQWLNGTHVPRAIYRNRIEAVTEGVVPADSWEADT